MSIEDKNISGSTSASTANPDDALFNYCISLADNSLIIGHRLSEWTGHGPMLEQDIALSNIALDLIGQARYFYQYAATIKNSRNFESTEKAEKVTEDSLAYLRDAKDFKNIWLAEIPNGDWGRTVLKLFFFSAYQYFLYQKLIFSSDKQLSAIAEKSLKEVTYHIRWSNEWVIRLGDGTEESHRRMAASLNEVWNYTGEIFISSAYENYCSQNKIGVDLKGLKIDWNRKISEVLKEATLPVPSNDDQQGNIVYANGKSGIHTEHLEMLLSEMQYLQRTYPGCEW